MHRFPGILRFPEHPVRRTLELLICPGQGRLRVLCAEKQADTPWGARKIQQCSFVGKERLTRGNAWFLLKLQPN